MSCHMIKYIQTNDLTYYEIFELTCDANDVENPSSLIAIHINMELSSKIQNPCLHVVIDVCVIHS